MTEYFKESDDSLTFYKLTEDGKIFELDIYFGQWDDVSEYQSFSPKWERVNEDYVNSFRLFIYVEQSDKYFQQHKEDVGIDNYKYGENFDFYIAGPDVISVDENNYTYLCSSKIMVPRMKKIDELPEDWYKLPLENAIDYIENQDGVFMSDMKMYFDDNGNVQGYLDEDKQFCLNLKNGQLDIVFDTYPPKDEWKECFISDPLFEDEKNEILLTPKQYEGLLALHPYIENSRKAILVINPSLNMGSEFKFYVNNFGKIICQDENNNIYDCLDDGLHISEIEDLEYFFPIDRFYVIQLVNEYCEHLKALPTKEITIRDLILLKNEHHQVIGLTEDGRKYYLSMENGEVEPLADFPDIREGWTTISRQEGIIIQGIIKDTLNETNKKN